VPMQMGKRSFSREERELLEENHRLSFGNVSTLPANRFFLPTFQTRSEKRSESMESFSNQIRAKYMTHRVVNSFCDQACIYSQRGRRRRV